MLLITNNLWHLDSALYHYCICCFESCGLKLQLLRFFFLILTGSDTGSSEITVMLHRHLHRTGLQCRIYCYRAEIKRTVKEQECAVWAIPFSCQAHVWAPSAPTNFRGCLGLQVKPALAVNCSCKLLMVTICRVKYWEGHQDYEPWRWSETGTALL